MNKLVFFRFISYINQNLSMFFIITDFIYFFFYDIIQIYSKEFLSMSETFSKYKLEEENDEFINLDDDDFIKDYTLRQLNKSIELKEYTNENELIKLTTTETMIIHFCEPSYKTCKAMNTGLQKCSLKFKNIRFGYINVYNCPLMAQSLEIQTLPFVGFFKQGFLIDELTGFEKLKKSNLTGILDIIELEKYIEAHAILKSSNIA